VARLSTNLMAFFFSGIFFSRSIFAQDTPVGDGGTQPAFHDQDVQKGEGQNAASEPAAIPQIVMANSHKLKIRVLQKGKGLPLQKVEIQAGEQKVFTDPDGNAEIEWRDSLKELNFVKAGFAQQSLAAADYKDTLEMDVFLFPKLGGDDEVIIKGKRRPSVSKKVISVQEAAKVAPGGDPGQIAKLLPGVTSQPGRSQVTIRGSEPNDSIYRIDDIETPYIYHAIGSLTVIPPSQIEDVEFSAGGFGPEYGDATGGALVVRTKSDIPERPLTLWTLNFPLYVSLFYERPLSENTGMSVSARRSYLDKVLPKVLPKDSGVTLVPFFSDYQGRWLRKTEDGHQKLTLLASSDGLKATVPNDSASNESGSQDFFLKTYFGAIAFEQSQKVNADWTLVSTPQWVYTDNQFETSELRFQVKAHNFRVPLEFSRRLSNSEKLYLGVEGSVVPYTVSYYLPQFDENDPYFDIDEAPRIESSDKGRLYRFASWASRDYQVGDFLMTPGLRIFHNSQNKSTGADPRFSTRYNWSKTQTPKFAIGQYSEFPKNGEATESFGNPSIKNIRAYHYILGIESKWDDRWDTDFQVFYKDVRDVILSDSATKYNNDGQLRSQGFEAFVRRSLTERWFGWVAYTYSRTEQRKNADADWFPGDHDQTHVLNVAGSYKWSATWETGGRISSHTGDTYTSQVGPAVYNANLDKYQSRAGDKSLNGARYPHYNELSLFNSNDFLYDRSKLTFRYGVEYFWFKRPVIRRAAVYDYSEELDTRGLPPIPFLELKGEF
jgi:hypothetical protein